MVSKNKKTVAAFKSDVVALNKMRFSDRFNGALAVDADEEFDTMTIGYIPTVGQTSSVHLQSPTYDDFADALVKLVSESYVAAKRNIKLEGQDLILKAISSSDFLVPIKSNLSKASKDVKIAKQIKAEFEAIKAQKAAKIASLTAELAELSA